MGGAPRVARTAVLAHPLDVATAEAVGCVAGIHSAEVSLADVPETHTVLLVPDRLSSAGGHVVHLGDGLPATKEAGTVKGAQGVAQLIPEVALAPMRARTRHTRAQGVALDLEAGVTPALVEAGVLGAPVVGPAVCLVVRVQLDESTDAVEHRFDVMCRYIKILFACSSSVAILYIACLHTPPRVLSHEDIRECI